MPAKNLILAEDSFDPWLETHSIVFFGNGSEKAASLIKHHRASFVTIETNASHMVALSAAKFERHQFSNLAYSEPFYGKEFHSPAANRKR